MSTPSPSATERPRANPPVEGDMIAGKYRVERVLGKGGMGVVVAAMHVQLRQRVAIKFLSKAATPEAVVRFLREARAAGRLQNEHVARVVDVGELDDSFPYMVMEYLEGSDLAHVLKERGPLPIDEAVTYMLQTCEAIAEAHIAGIVHRDIKPANIFLRKAADGSINVKVLDFGISKTLEEQSGEDEEQLTSALTILGSPLYMSPEQLRSASKVDTRSDLWSLGVVLYQLLTASYPLKGASYSDQIILVHSERPPAPSALRPDIPPELDAAILRCLEKNPEVRFSNVGELAWALAPFAPPEARTSAERITRRIESAGGQVQRSIPPPSAALSATAAATTSASTDAQTLGPTVGPPGMASSSSVAAGRRRTPAPVVIGVAVGLALAFSGLIILLRSSSPAPPSAAVANSSPGVLVIPSAPSASLVVASAVSNAVVPPAVTNSTAAPAPLRSAARGSGTAATPLRPSSTGAATTAKGAPPPAAEKNPLDVVIK